MSFDSCNRPLKIWESIETPTLEVGAHLGVCGFIPSHPHTFPRTWNVTLGLHSWLTPLQTFVFVKSPKLRLWHKTFQTFYPFFIYTSFSSKVWTLEFVYIVHIMLNFYFFVLLSIMCVVCGVCVKFCVQFVLCIMWVLACVLGSFWKKLWVITKSRWPRT
jgi:hypothetical protein